MAEPAADLKSVLLDARHRALGGRMVPFSGYELPVQYPTGIIAEHKWTREHAGLFDVSHMGPSFLTFDINDERFSEAAKAGDLAAGLPQLAALIEPLISGDVASLKLGQLRYTLLLNEDGGIIDDLIVGFAGAGNLYIIVNAGTKEGDFARIEAAVGGRATLNRRDRDSVLLALQGPDAAAVMDAVGLTAIAPRNELSFMTVRSDWWGGRSDGCGVTLSRSGYTGEDGFELLVPNSHAAEVWDTLLADPRVKPIGLGARDSLRLEAGLPLYGHDLDETISPTEAGLNFALSKRRREAADFPGAARILKEFAGNLTRIRVGLAIDGAPARDGADILGPDGTPLGKITSGGFSPTLGRAIALGFVPPAHAAPGTRLAVSVRGRAQAAEVVALPFVPHRYHRKPA